jgi:multiple sugar transport system ATP-binding protein
VGSPLELYEHPRNLFVAGFIGSPKMNVLEGTVVAASKSEATVQVGGGSVRCLVDASRAKVGDKVTLGVRPEHFEVGGAENALPTKVVFVETLGSATVAYCEYAGASEPLTCELDGRVRPKNGAAVTLSVPAACAYVFDADGAAMRRLAPGQLEQRAA